MQSRKSKVTTIQLLCATLLWLSSLMATAAAPSFVYINANINTPGQNAVIALANDGAGNLTPVAGSPFATGGTGVAGVGTLLNDIQWDSDGELAINAQGTLLFAVNGHSNDISGFTVNADGSLILTPGSPFPSHGTQPASIAYRDDPSGIATMIVANKDSDPFQTESAPNFTSFSVDSTGVPVWNSNSTLTLSVGSSPWQFVMPKHSKSFFAILFTGNAIDTLRLSRAGKIVMTGSLPTDAENGGGALNPKSNALYVTLPIPHLINVMSYDTNYNLSLVQTLDDPGQAPCWAATNRAGTRLYITETPSGTLSVYDVSDPLAPVLLQHLQLAGTTKPYPTHVRFDPSESFLYVLNRHGRLHVLDVAGDGTLSEIHTPYNLALPSGKVPPLGLAVVRNRSSGF
jgi:6-phosphogluconolactonase (cycloisomerase 2 family)